jgi:hypothetical protein
MTLGSKQMPRKDMRKALGASLRAEQDAVKTRFERAETALARTGTPTANSREERVVRDSFTMPTDEYERIAALKKRMLTRGVSATKSEVLRAGLAVLNSMDDKQLVEILTRVPKVKTGRPPQMT